MKNMKRALRRHHFKRRQAAEFKKWSRIWQDDKEHAIMCSRVYRDLRTPCSCYMCGNPRKYFKELTIQERKFYEI